MLNIRTGALAAVVLLTLGITATSTRAKGILDEAAQVTPADAAATPATEPSPMHQPSYAFRPLRLSGGGVPKAVLAPTGSGTEPVFEPLLLPTSLVQRSGDDYDRWRASMDAATAKRRRGIILTAGGFLGGPLVAGVAFSAGGQGEGAAKGAYYVSLAGLGVGAYGVFQWISGHSEVSRLRDEGNRAGYVFSVSPVQGGAVGTVALSF